MIRCENSSLEEEISAIGSMVRRAFASVPDHHGNEQDGVAEEQLISRLRKNENVFFPQLSLVYVENDEIIGHVLLTKIEIKKESENANENLYLALAPLAVDEKHRNKGIASALMKFAHEKAKELNADAIFILGDPKFYSKFGYKESTVQFPFGAPNENCMHLELKEDCLKQITGELVYPKEFFE